MSVNVLEIDGSVLEGGGQILRISMCLSAILGTPIKVSNIRMGRSKPGLAAQHLSGIQLVAEMCGGKLLNAQMQSTEITFHPGTIRGGCYKADPRTAGSISLLIQVGLPCALYADSTVEFDLKGGTHVQMAPPIGFMAEVFLHNLAKFGAAAKIKELEPGFFPKGGGHVEVRIEPVEVLKGIELTEFGEIERIYGESYAYNLPIWIGENMREGAMEVIASRKICDNIDISRPKKAERLGKNGSGLLVFCQTKSGAVLGSSALGRRDVKPLENGRKVGEEICYYHDLGVPFDNHMQDQLILLMALAKGKSRVRVSDITMHTKTAMHVVRLFCKDVKFEIIPDGKTNIIECEGIGFHNPHFCKQES